MKSREALHLVFFFHGKEEMGGNKNHMGVFILLKNLLI